MLLWKSNSDSFLNIQIFSHMNSDLCQIKVAGLGIKSYLTVTINYKTYFDRLIIVNNLIKFHSFSLGLNLYLHFLQPKGRF